MIVPTMAVMMMMMMNLFNPWFNNPHMSVDHSKEGASGNIAVSAGLSGRDGANVRLEAGTAAVSLQAMCVSIVVQARHLVEMSLSQVHPQRGMRVEIFR